MLGAKNFVFIIQLDLWSYAWHHKWLILPWKVIICKQNTVILRFSLFPFVIKYLYSIFISQLSFLLLHLVINHVLCFRIVVAVYIFYTVSNQKKKYCFILSPGVYIDVMHIESLKDFWKKRLKADIFNAKILINIIRNCIC